MQPREWLNQLYVAVANVPPDIAVVDARIDATIFACALLPQAVWCPDALREACQEIKLFPAASEVYSVLMRWCSTYLPRRAPLSIDAPERASAPPERLSQASAELAAKTVAALHSSADDRERGGHAAATPRPLSPSDILAEYEALAAKNDRCGTPSSAVNRRIEMLRRA